MKRTILATVIAATSFGAMAEDRTPLTGEEKLHLVGEQMIKNGGGIQQNADNGNIVIDSAKGHQIVINSQGEVIAYGDKVLETPVAIDGSHTNGGEEVTAIVRNSVSKEMEVRQDLRRDTRQTQRRADRIILDPIVELPTPVEPIAGNPDAVKAHAKSVVNNYQVTASNEDKLMRLKGAAAKQGYGVDTYVNANGDDVLTFTDADGNTKAVLAEDFTSYMATKQEERSAERMEEGDNPINGGKGRKAVDAIKDYVDAGDAINPGENGQGTVIAHSQAAQAQTQSQIDELYALGNQNASDIDTLFSEVDRLDTRIDQTQALNAATVNARPMVANGMTAFGAGVGYAGSEAALAIGVAHSFVDTGWSASGTLAASSDDVVVGGGVQYAF